MKAGAEPTIKWLLESREPAIRRLVRRELLGQVTPQEDALGGPLVRGLLAGQQSDGGFGDHPYNKWEGAHWRLVSLVELGIPAGQPRALAALEQVLTWLNSDRHRDSVPVIKGRSRRCGSQEGNALAVASRLGAAYDERVALLATDLMRWQWPDGGWNCDRRPEAHRSSFHETLPPIWGLHEYASATGNTEAAESAAAGADLLLDHRMFRSLQTGERIKDEWLTFKWPPFWHYDVLQAMVVLERLGRAKDERATDAIEVIESRRRSDGRWRASNRWWRPPGSSRAGEAVDWQMDDSGDRLVTLRALIVLGSADQPAQQQLGESLAV